MKKAAEDAGRLLAGLSQQWAEVSRFIRDFLGPINDLRKIELSRQELAKRIQPFGDIINRIIATFRPTTAQLQDVLVILADGLDKEGSEKLAIAVDEVIKKIGGEPTEAIDMMIKLANYFDQNKRFELANIIDETTDMFTKFANYTFIPKGKQKAPEIEPPMQLACEGLLSTRYCPDHRGAQAIRLAEHIYQCPLDGKIYNYETGYTNYQGQRVLGGSVANQTEDMTDFGGIPMRVYDSRQNTLNRTY